MIEGILTGLQAAFTIEAILLVVLGCIVGSFIGMVPGLGPMQVIAIMIPIAVGLGDPAVAMIMLAGSLRPASVPRCPQPRLATSPPPE